jgi:hypothetical protein
LTFPFNINNILQRRSSYERRIRVLSFTLQTTHGGEELMGTNYYYTKFTRCKECGHITQEEVHIGKSSFGWMFHFQYETFTDPKNWKQELKGKYITDEYHKEISYDEFIDLVEVKQKTIEPKKDPYFKFGENFFIIENYLFFTGEWS